MPAKATSGTAKRKPLFAILVALIIVLAVRQGSAPIHSVVTSIKACDAVRSIPTTSVHPPVDDNHYYSTLLERAIQKEDIKNKIFWEWKYYSRIMRNNNDNNNYNNNNTTKGLIVQYADHFNYAALRQESARANEAYAFRYGYDYLAVHGVMLQEGIMIVPGAGAFNKPYILQHILDQVVNPPYDFVFLIDSDAVITNFTIDAASLIDPTRVFVCHIGVPGIQDDGTHLINNGVTIWNFRHDLIGYTLLEWVKRITISLQTQSANISIDDQDPLHEVLYDYRQQHPGEQKRLSKGLHGMFETGIFVHHLLRSNFTQGRTPTFFKTYLDQRLDLMKQIVDQTCAQYECGLPDAVETETFITPTLSRPAGVCRCFF